jgi:hypothetical protein
LNSPRAACSNFEPATDRRFRLRPFDPSPAARRRLLLDALASGGAASIASTVALLAYGEHECGDMAAPLNGPSQWVWGRHAPYRDGFSWRYTFVGFLVHHLASTFWAAIYAAMRGPRAPPARSVATAATVAAVAYVVDYRLTPQRLTPGFEHRISRRALAAVYVLFAAGLAAGALVRARHSPGRITTLPRTRRSATSCKASTPRARG